MEEHLLDPLEEFWHKFTEANIHDRELMLRDSVIENIRNVMLLPDLQLREVALSVLLTNYFSDYACYWEKREKEIKICCCGVEHSGQ